MPAAESIALRGIKSSISKPMPPEGASGTGLAPGPALPPMTCKERDGTPPPVGGATPPGPPEAGGVDSGTPPPGPCPGGGGAMPPMAGGSPIGAPMPWLAVVCLGGRGATGLGCMALWRLSAIPSPARARAGIAPRPAACNAVDARFPMGANGCNIALGVIGGTWGCGAMVGPAPMAAPEGAPATGIPMPGAARPANAAALGESGPNGVGAAGAPAIVPIGEPNAAPPPPGGTTPAP